MAEYAPGIDLVCVNYRTPGDLARFLNSVPMGCADVEARLWIVNVMPEAIDVEVVEESNPGVEVGGHLRSNDNCGYGRACNGAAARMVEPREVIGLFNADVELWPYSVAECCRALLDHDDWAVVGPRQIDDSRRLVHAGIFGPDTAPAHRGWMEHDAGQYADVVEAYSVSGSAYFMRRSVWDELAGCPVFRASEPTAAGAFLPTPLWYEETWASVHARKHGHRVMYLGTVTMTHRLHGSVNLHGGTQWEKESHERFRAACRDHGIDHN